MSERTGSTIDRTAVLGDEVTFLAGAGSRRAFLRNGTLATLAAAALAACKPAARAADSTAAATATAGTSVTGGTMPPAAVPTARQTADAMDAMHEKGIKAFPAKTEGKGNIPLEPRIEEGVKVFELTAKKVHWEVTPGQKVEAWTYNGLVPGPQIRVREGDACASTSRTSCPSRRRCTSTASSCRTTGRRAVHHAAADQAG